MKTLLDFCLVTGKISFLLLVLSIISGSAFAQQKTLSSPQTDELDDDGVPILIKHLPDWENAKKRATVVANLPELQKLSGNRPILNEIEFTAGTEAVTASYDKARLVIVEFSTPQMALDIDRKIQAKLPEISQPATQIVYRKIGNYSVFVFDAPDEASANTLLNGVSYEKTVNWLGGNPFPGIAAARKEKEYLATTGDIIVTVVKTSGLAFIAALGVGGLLGAFIFYRRRAQQTGMNAYSDAGGMVRLNLDEMTPQTDASRLLKK
ncbi:MAG: hypothetical protein ABI954_09975 [Pyrinomonadaceae bacterium]